MPFTTRRVRQALCLALATTLGVTMLTDAQTMPGGAAPAVPAAPAERPAFPDLASVTKDMQAVPGLITLYRYRADDPSKDHTRLLAQIPRQLLRQDLLLATSISRGQQAGHMSVEYLIRFEILGKQVVINTPDPRYVQSPNQPVNDVINRTYTDGFLAALPIVAMAGADPVVDLGSALLSTGLAFPDGGVAGGLRRELCQYTKLKSFPDNTLIEVEMALGAFGGPGQRIGVAYALRSLPPLGSYRPRIADERVGYFTTVRQDWAMKYSERENIIRYVNRWDLKKKDPSLELSPPEKPIVFIIEKTVPLQWRKYVAEGIREWNKAYEKLGIVEAIVVQQQTDDNEFAHIDPEDARYNFFRWIVSGRAFAMGPSRADPRTGQILDADIIFDDSMVRSWYEDAETFAPRMLAATMGPDTLRFLLDNPTFMPAGYNVDDIQEALNELNADSFCNAPSHREKEAWAWNQRVRRSAGCGYAVGLRHELSLANLAAAAAAPGKKVPDRLMGEMIRHTVTHEIGHTLGLRHNFKASSWLKLDDVKRLRDTSDEPTSASIMDYNGLLLFTGDDVDKLRHLNSPCTGPYDHWAIEYGYRTAGPQDGDEKAMLAKIASRNTERELAFATDEDTVGIASPDPMVNRWDMGEDPIAWARMRSQMSDALLKNVRKWAVSNDEPRHYLRAIVGTLMSEKARNMGYVSRLVGGQMFNRNRGGDPNAKPMLVPVEAKRQREAIDMLASTLFRDDYFAVDPDLLNDLGPSRWWDWTSNPATRLDFPLHQVIMSYQASSLMYLCSPQVLQRVYDAEMKGTVEDRFTAAQLITKVRDAIWTGLNVPDNATFSDAKPLLTSIRRNLQRQHLQYLLAIADSESSSLVSPDIQSMTRFALRELAEQINGALTKARTEGGSRLDFATRAHLTECKAQIDRVLNAPYVKAAPAAIRILTTGQQQPQQQE